jgi:hypothetical protein
MALKNHGHMPVKNSGFFSVAPNDVSSQKKASLFNEMVGLIATNEKISYRSGQCDKFNKNLKTVRL